MPVFDPNSLKPKLNVTRITDVAGLEKLKEFFKNNKTIGFDVETDPKKDYFWRKCRTIQFGNKDEQYVIDLLAFYKSSSLLFDGQGSYGAHNPPEIQPVLDVITPVLTSKEWLKIGVSLSFEYTTMYWNFGIRSFNFYDCMVVEKVIYAGYHTLKDYGFFSMSEMFGRYFGFEIDKSLQESFDLISALTDEQWEYAALDTRIPLAIKAVQEIIISGRKPTTVVLESILLGDDLREVCQIENDAIGSFVELFVHGEDIDTIGWNKWIDDKEVQFKKVISQLDDLFIPLVGSVDQIITQEHVDLAEASWKKLSKVSEKELILKKLGKTDVNKLEEFYKAERDRKDLRDTRRKAFYELRGFRKEQLELLEICQGKALINYDSSDQLLEVLQRGFKGLERIKSTGDEVLEAHDNIPVAKLLQTYREISKILSTYGRAWASTWVSHPCKEEGWLHPGDGRIHHVYNQQEAETGRSSSEAPNGQNLPPDPRKFYVAGGPDPCLEILGEEYVYVTADMSGAELRIIAECADDPIWIGAFSRGEDVHSVGAEILFPVEWPLMALPDCAYFSKNSTGEYARKKCECPQHKEKRKENKSNNFLLAYGGGPTKLASEIKKLVSYAKELMARHQRSFPKIWDYLKKSGVEARQKRKSFDMFGRRRIFKKPTREDAINKAKEDFKDKLKYDKEICKKNREEFILKFGRKPTKEEAWILNHRPVSEREIVKSFVSIEYGYERQGKNHRIQGTNATIAKLAMGAGYDKDGKPYLWHTLPKFHATIRKFVHDELVVKCPKRYAKEVAELIGDAFKRAAATKMTKVIMTFDYVIGSCWEKH